MNNGRELVVLLYMHEHCFFPWYQYITILQPLVHAYNFRLIDYRILTNILYNMYDLKKWMGAFQSLSEFCRRILGINIDSSFISSGRNPNTSKLNLLSLLTVLCFSTVVLCKHRDWRARISMLKFRTKTILMTFRKHWPVCQPASHTAEIEVIIHNISKLWKVIHSKNGGINDKPEENAELEDVRIKIFLRQVFQAPVMKYLLIHNFNFFSILLTFSLFFIQVTFAHFLGRPTYPIPPPPDILKLLQICI